MDGRDHFIIGTVATGLALWGTQAIGLHHLDTANIILGAFVARLGSIAPDIDHPKSTVSRRLPRELGREALYWLMIPVTFVVVIALSGDVKTIPQVLQAWSKTPFFQWALIMGGIAVVLIAIAFIASRVFQHRGATHSLVFTAGATALVAVACRHFNVAWWWGLVFGWGWLLHILADATTEMGLPSLLWPFSSN
jgi:membrane-bound metal-dependent hydrolase YbcI (DUF457 family)